MTHRGHVVMTEADLSQFVLWQQPMTGWPQSGAAPHSGWSRSAYGNDIELLAAGGSKTGTMALMLRTWVRDILVLPLPGSIVS